MRIETLELFPVPPRWLFLRIGTDDGAVGWGEPTLEGHAATVARAVEEIGERVLGRDPRRVEDLVQVLYRGGFYRGGPVLASAVSGIEQALWDIKARALGVPVHELMGGRVRDRVRVYGWVGGDGAEDAARAAAALVSRGFTAVKLNAVARVPLIDTPERTRAAVERVEAVRAAVGWNVDIALDFHGRVHQGMARRLLRDLEPTRPLFVEEPVLVEQLELYPELGRLTAIPLAAGERLYTRWGFKELVTRGGVAVAQPDVSHAGGIWECRKIAAMAEAYDVAMAPHCPLGPIALAAALQLDACTPNFLIQEQSLGIHYNQGADLLDYLADPGPFAFVEGHLAVPDGPGLGIEVDEARVRRAAGSASPWRNPLWRLDDGTVAEW